MKSENLLVGYVGIVRCAANYQNLPTRQRPKSNIGDTEYCEVQYQWQNGRWFPKNGSYIKRVRNNYNKEYEQIHSGSVILAMEEDYARFSGIPIP